MERQRGATRIGRISVNLTPEELVRLQAVAEAECRSVSNLCRQLIQAFLAQQERGS